MLQDRRLSTTPLMIGTLLIAVLVVTGDAAAQRRYEPRVVAEHHYGRGYAGANQLVFEAGAAMPLGDLGDDFETTDQGLDAKTGYEVGLRYRYFVQESLAVSPAFHYADFGDDQGTYLDGDVERGFEVETAVYRFGVDLQQFFGPPDGEVRAYLSVGVALYHNRYEDFITGLGSFPTSSNSLGAAAGAGLVLGPVELSGSYNLDRTTNDDLPSATADDGFNWDHLTVRAGLVLANF